VRRLIRCRLRLAVLFVLPILGRPPSSPRFPYTTLFRSSNPAPTSPRASVRASRTNCRPHWRRAPTGSRVRPRRAGTACCSRTKRSEEHTSELQSRENLVCRLLLEKKKKYRTPVTREDDS